MTTDLVPADHMSALERLDPAMQEVAVSTYLDNARRWLSGAVEMTGPEQIAAKKAEIATAAEATKQLNLSKEIQLDAEEMVRRAEYALGKAVRKGQAEGTIAKQGSIGSAGAPGVYGGQPGSSRGDHLGHPHEVAGEHKATLSAIYQMSDGASPEEFDQAVAEAKSEGNLSRANVVRKVKKQDGPATRHQRADLIADLADEGYSSRQMPPKVGVSEETVRQIARDFDIDIPADRIVANTRRFNSTHVAEQTVDSLETLVSGIAAIDYDDIDYTDADQWVDSLSASLTELRRFLKKIKETVQ